MADTSELNPDGSHTDPTNPVKPAGSAAMRGLKRILGIGGSGVPQVPEGQKSSEIPPEPNVEGQSYTKKGMGAKRKQLDEADKY